MDIFGSPVFWNSQGSTDDPVVDLGGGISAKRSQVQGDEGAFADLADAGFKIARAIHDAKVRRWEAEEAARQAAEKESQNDAE